MNARTDASRIFELIAQLDQLCDEARRLRSQAAARFGPRRPFWPERRVRSSLFDDPPESRTAPHRRAADVLTD